MIDQIYAYRTPSNCAEGELGLATSGGTGAFVSAWFEEPACLAAALLVVARNAREHFHRPDWRWSADPVVTCEPGWVRFESLSGCAGAYARLDLDVGAAAVRPGTTNVDFNPPMRTALARVDNRAPLHLAVGEESVSVLTAEGSVTELRVPLPERWVRGFAQAGTLAAGLREGVTLDAPAAVKLLRAAATAREKGAWYVVAAGREARLSRVPRAGAVAAAGLERLRLLGPLMAWAQGLRIFGGEHAVSGWVLELPGMRLTLLLSPELWRGLSGEGAALGAQGFDLAVGAPFARVLPFDAPVPRDARGKAAARLVETGGVRLEGGDRAWVRGTGGVEHRVRLGADPACTCTWWAQHPGDRGPCRHLLAVRMVAADA